MLLISSLKLIYLQNRIASCLLCFQAAMPEGVSRLAIRFKGGVMDSIKQNLIIGFGRQILTARKTYEKSLEFYKQNKLEIPALFFGNFEGQLELADSILNDYARGKFKKKNELQIVNALEDSLCLLAYDRFCALDFVYSSVPKILNLKYDEGAKISL